MTTPVRTICYAGARFTTREGRTIDPSGCVGPFAA